MIDYVYSTNGDYLSIASSPGSQPYINPSQPMTGMVRFYNNRFEVYNGSHWDQVGGGSATVSLTPKSISILQWAEKKMQEEADLLKLAERHPGIADLVNEMKQAEDKLKAFAELVKEE